MSTPLILGLVHLSIQFVEIFRRSLHFPIHFDQFASKISEGPFEFNFLLLQLFFGLLKFQSRFLRVDVAAGDGATMTDTITCET